MHYIFHTISSNTCRNYVINTRTIFCFSFTWSNNSNKVIIFAFHHINTFCPAGAYIHAIKIIHVSWVRVCACVHSSFVLLRSVHLVKIPWVKVQEHYPFHFRVFIPSFLSEIWCNNQPREGYWSYLMFLDNFWVGFGGTVLPSNLSFLLFFLCWLQPALPTHFPFMVFSPFF